jgi:hypothetical protein
MNKSIWVIFILVLAVGSSLGARGSKTELTDWQFVGKGFTAKTDGGFLLSEYPGSSGVMLISPETYACGTKLHAEMLPMNPESVVVVMMAASTPGPDKFLKFPETYDGNIGPLLDDTEAYFFALHNAAHNRTPFVRRHPFDRSASKDLATFPQHVMTRRWHTIEVVHACDGGLHLAVDDKTILEVSDSNPLENGQIVLRLRGTKTHVASALFRNVRLETD